MRHFIAVTPLDTAELVECFVQFVYRLYSAPKTVVSDCGSAFISDFWIRFNARLSVSLLSSSAFNPQISGQTQILSFLQIIKIMKLPVFPRSSQIVDLINALALSQQIHSR